jgi:hypothetical protein
MLAARGRSFYYLFFLTKTTSNSTHKKHNKKINNNNINNKTYYIQNYVVSFHQGQFWCIACDRVTIPIKPLRGFGIYAK